MIHLRKFYLLCAISLMLVKESVDLYCTMLTVCSRSKQTHAVLLVASLQICTIFLESAVLGLRADASPNGSTYMGRAKTSLRKEIYDPSDGYHISSLSL